MYIYATPEQCLSWCPRMNCKLPDINIWVYLSCHRMRICILPSKSRKWLFPLKLARGGIGEETYVLTTPPSPN